MTSMKPLRLCLAALFAATLATLPAIAQQQRPNILVIMGDDVGWFNIAAYHRGIMSGKTPNLDRLASEGMMFTDYYAEANCTAGRAKRVFRLPLPPRCDVGPLLVQLPTGLDRQGRAAQFGAQLRDRYR